MVLLFSVDRVLARVAAEARHDRERRAALGEPWWANLCPQATPPPPREPTQFGRGLAPDDPQRESLERALEIALVGEHDRLGDALTDDAQGWSPTMSFRSRGEAEEHRRDLTSTLRVECFGVDLLCWADPFVFAEWHLVACQIDGLLVGDEVLIDDARQTVSLVGAAIAETRGTRITRLHTYFDDASLIEQVVLDR